MKAGRKGMSRRREGHAGDVQSGEQGHQGMDV